jgi:hypothetical protein
MPEIKIQELSRLFVFLQIKYSAVFFLYLTFFIGDVIAMSLDLKK